MVGLDQIALAVAVLALLLASWNLVSMLMRGGDDDSAIASKVRQLDADLDDLFDRMKRLTSRKGMQAKREEDAGKPSKPRSDETPAQWKARMRKEFPNGIPHTDD